MRSHAMKSSAAMFVMLSVVSMCVAPRQAGAAGKYDGSVPMVCSVSAVTECQPGRRCQARTAENVNLPSLFRVDTKAMKIRNLEAEKGRESPIRNVDHANGALVLQGSDADRGWTVVVHEETGKMSGTVSADGEGFVVFGQCGLP
jgi:hypothetical protein